MLTSCQKRARKSVIIISLTFFSSKIFNSNSSKNFNETFTYILIKIDEKATKISSGYEKSAKELQKSSFTLKNLK